MRRLTLFCLIALIASCHVGSAQDAPAQVAPAPTAAELQAVVSANNQFGLDLFHKLGDAESNVCFSPLNLHRVLSMVLTGARGETNTELADALHVDLSPDRYHLAYAGFREQLRRGHDGRIMQVSHVAALWPSKDFVIDPAYIQTCQSAYSSEVRALDPDSEIATKAVNAWIAEKTHNRIPSLIAPGQIKANTALVLTGVLYVKAKWTSPFNKRLTRPDSFYRSSTDIVEVHMMRQQGSFLYSESGGAKVLSMPYSGGNQSLVLVLPSSAGKLAALEADMDAATVDGWVHALRPATVQVSLPRFSVDEQNEMKDAVQALGVKRLFTLGDAQLGGMGSFEGAPAVEGIQHRATIAVDESGTVAAAASAVEIGGFGFEEIRPPMVFNANQPFLFFLRDDTTGAILMMGRVVNPVQAP